MGFSPTFGARRFPKGNEGKRVSSGYNRRRRLATRSSGKQQAERTAVRTAPIVCPEESPLVRPQAHTPVPERPDAPTTARLVGLPPRGGQYFLSKRKKVPKKARGTATTGKSPLLPIFERGSSQCRAQTSWIAISYCRARSCSLFSSFKKGKAFSLRCLSPLCSPAAGVGQTQTAVLGMLRCGWDGFAAQNSRLGFCSTVGINNHAQTTQLGCFDAAWIFSRHKRPAGFHIHAGLYCEP